MNNVCEAGKVYKSFSKITNNNKTKKNEDCCMYIVATI